MTNNKLSINTLQHFHGSENFYKHFGRNLIFTDGIKFLAEQAGGYWLIDEIAFAMPKLLKKHSSPFYSVDFEVSENKSADIIFTDGNDNEIIKKHIKWTDFPLVEQKITMFLSEDARGYCLMLASEY